MSFTNFHKQMKVPYVVYADFECVLRKIDSCEPSPDASFTVKTEKHEPCGFSYMAVRSDGMNFGPFTHKGEDAVYVFLMWLQNHEREMCQDMANKRPLVMTNEDWQKYRGATESHICNKGLVKDIYCDSLAVYDPDSCKYAGQSHRKCYHQAAKNKYVPHERRKPKDEIDQWIANNQETCLFCGDSLLVPNFKDSVRDHDHITGKYREAAHNECNFKLKLNPKTAPIPVIFHNLKGYDGHLLQQGMPRVNGEINCIPTNTEKYISFSLGNMRFIDSMNFMQSSLEKLVKGSDKFPIMQRTFTDDNKQRLLLKKGIYPHEYMDSFERFDETQLPEKEEFYSSLSGKGITDEEYEHAQEVWAAFGCRTMGDYHDLYVTTDVLLLADVFENFRQVYQEKYGLDPAHYYSAPGLSWDALLKKTGVELELLTDLDMHLFIERGMRGGISTVSKRYARANNPLIEGYNAAEPTKYITYLDANNLYGWAMSLSLPKNNFHWNRVMPTEEQIMKIRPNAKKGWILEVDPEYPEELHDAHKDYPLAPEKKAIDPWKMSEYQRRLMRDLGLEPPNTEKLVLTLEDKEKYVVHYKNLQFYLRQGMRLKKVHRVLEFDQEPWMEPYIRMNTEFRKQARSDFETDFYKLMNNSVFGKTMANLRNRVDVKIVREWEQTKIRKLVSDPAYNRFTVFSNDMAGIHMHKRRLVLHKPDDPREQQDLDVRLLLQPPESQIRTEVRSDLHRHGQLALAHPDRRRVPGHERPLMAVRHKQLLQRPPAVRREKQKGLGQDEGRVRRRAGRRSGGVKAEDVLNQESGKQHKEGEGGEKNVIEKEITHENYKEALFGKKQYMHKMKILRSEGHEMYGMCMNKISISPFDTKRWIAGDGVHTLAYGHRAIRPAGAAY